MFSWYAYLIAFAGVSLEGELSLITATIAAQKGLLDLWIMVPLAFTGTLLVDWGVFFSSRFLGKQLFKWIPSLRRAASRPHVRLEQSPQLISFLYRFMYGFRVITLIMLGTSRISSVRFMSGSLMAITVWVSVYTALGYYLGKVVQRYFIFLDNYIWYFVIIILFLLLIVFLIKWISKRMLD